mgnify:CR=1 FL=1
MPTAVLRRGHVTEVITPVAPMDVERIGACDGCERILDSRLRGNDRLTASLRPAASPGSTPAEHVETHPAREQSESAWLGDGHC